MEGFSKNKKGISLIVLVITIIVMIILAAAIILSLNGSDIIGKANEAKNDSDKTNMLESANMLAAEYLLKVNTGEKVEDKLSEYVTKQLKSQGFKEEEIAKLEIDDDKGTVKYVGSDDSTPSTVHYGIIPEGGTYYSGLGFNEYNFTAVYRYTDEINVYTTGDNFPEPQEGDIYIYGDYQYCYGAMYYDVDCSEWYDDWYGIGSGEGWCVTVVDRTKSKYSDILTKINNVSVTDSCSLFYGCINLVSAPVIPSCICSLGDAFSGCKSLTGEVEINSDELIYYDFCFAGTNPQNTIILTGTCLQLSELFANPETYGESGPLGNIKLKDDLNI